MDILGVKIDNLTMNEAVKRVGDFMADNRQRYLVTVNPEFLVEAQRDKKFKGILNRADLAAADGIGLIFASWFKRQPLKQRVTGVDLMENICNLASQKKWPVRLLGGEDGVDKKTADNLKKRYPQLKIEVMEQLLDRSPSAEGLLSGGYSKNAANNVILFVAFGMIKQEKWISENLKKMPQVKLAMGVGGAFDFIGGKVRRAPKILRVAGLEWFWRLMLQPWRIRRVFRAAAVFPFLVLREWLIGLGHPR